MTDTNTLAPTDDDLRALWRQHAPVVGGTLSFARAVLAKWGMSAPASQPVAVPAGMEPVAHLIVRSAFRVSPHGQDAEGNEWLEEAQSPEEPGAFAVFTAAQVQAMLTAAPSGPAREPLTDEQIDQAIAELGLNCVAEAHTNNRAVLHALCRRAAREADHGITDAS